MKKKTEQINMSATETELNFMRKSAKQLGVSLSEFIRAPCLDSHPLPPPEVNWKDYTEKIREVGRQIDALALQGNTKKWIDPDDAIRQMGYEVKRFNSNGEPLAHPAIKPPPDSDGTEHNFFRVDKFTDGYTEEDIKQRIEDRILGEEDTPKFIHFSAQPSKGINLPRFDNGGIFGFIADSAAPHLKPSKDICIRAWFCRAG